MQGERRKEMRRTLGKGLLIIGLVVAMAGCETFKGPDKTGELRLSSETFPEAWYLLGYNYEEGEYSKFRFQGEAIPDIINEGIRVLADGEVKYLPGFNTPGQVNGFALLETFGNIDDARSYYNDYRVVENDLQFETISDTVELYQVWVQQTSAGNYAKLLIRDILHQKAGGGAPFSEVVLDFTYQPDGSAGFPD